MGMGAAGRGEAAEHFPDVELAQGNKLAEETPLPFQIEGPLILGVADLILSAKHIAYLCPGIKPKRYHIKCKDRM